MENGLPTVATTGVEKPRNCVKIILEAVPQKMRKGSNAKKDQLHFASELTLPVRSESHLSKYLNT